MFENPPPPKVKKKTKRGFASMNPERLRALAAQGGSRSKPEDRYFAKNPDAARAAGIKGGKVTKAMKEDGK